MALKVSINVQKYMQTDKASCSLKVWMGGTTLWTNRQAWASEIWLDMGYYLLHVFVVKFPRVIIKMQCVSCSASVFRNENKWCFRPRFCTVKFILGRRQPGWMKWILLWTIPWRRIDRSTCWSAVQRATTVPWMPLVFKNVVYVSSVFSFSRTESLQ